MTNPLFSRQLASPTSLNIQRPQQHGECIFARSSSSSLTSLQSYGHSYGGHYGGGGGGWGGGYGDGDRMSNLGGGLRSVDWASTRLEHFEKNFYIEDKRVTARSEKEVEDFRRAKEIRVSGTLRAYMRS